MKRLSLFFCALALLGADAYKVRIGGPLPMRIAAAPSWTNTAIDAAAEKVAWIFQAPEDVTMTTFLFRYGARTGTPVAHKISVQTVDAANGAPTGTVSAAATFTPPADTTWDGTVQAVTVSHDGSGGSISSVSLARGSFYAIVIETCPDTTAPCSAAASADASNFGSFTTVLSSVGYDLSFLPYNVNYAGSWGTKSNSTPVYGYRSASKSYGLPVVSFCGAPSNSSCSARLIASGAEQAVSFTIPAAWISTYKIAGVRWAGTSSAAGKTLKVNLYSGTTVLQTAVWDTDIATTASANKTGEMMFAGALSTLSAGTEYRIGFTPQDTAQNFALMTVDLLAAGDRSAFPGGSIFAYSSRSGCGAPCDTTSTAWTDDTAVRPFVELILEDITPPVGGAAGTTAFTFIQ